MSAIDQAVSAPAGPVHINCRFRDPLVPGVAGSPVPEDILARANRLYHRQEPYTIYPSQTTVIANPGDCADILRKTRRGLVVVGRLDAKDDAPALEKFLQSLNWPVFCDIASGLKGRVNPARQIFTFDHPEAVRLVADYDPDTILQFGSGLVSKQYTAAILPQSKARVIQVSPRQRAARPGAPGANPHQGNCGGLCRVLRPCGITAAGYDGGQPAAATNGRFA